LCPHTRLSCAIPLSPNGPYSGQHGGATQLRGDWIAWNFPAGQHSCAALPSSPSGFFWPATTSLKYPDHTTTPR
jgi:hypothetical protein